MGGDIFGGFSRESQSPRRFLFLPADDGETEEDVDGEEEAFPTWIIFVPAVFIATHAGFIYWKRRRRAAAETAYNDSCEMATVTRVSGRVVENTDPETSRTHNLCLVLEPVGKEEKEQVDVGPTEVDPATEDASGYSTADQRAALGLDEDVNNGAKNTE